MRIAVTTVLVTLALAGCGKKDPGPAKPTAEPVATTQPADVAAEKPADAAAEKPADAAAEKPTDAAAEKPADAGAEKPADAAAEAPKPLTPAEVQAKFDALRAAAAGEPEKLAALYADDAVIGTVDSPDQQKGGAGAASFYGSMMKAFPDFKVTPQVIVVGNDRVVAILLGTGTNTGELAPGQAATGKKVGLIGAQYVVWGADGKIKSDLHFIDQTSMAGQLGLLPPNVPFRPLVESGVVEPVVVLATASQAEQDAVAAHRKGQAALNAKDIKTLEELDAQVADDLVFHINSFPADITGKADYQKMFGAFLSAHPDMKSDGDDIWAAGDFVIHQSTMSGTNTGEMAMGDMKTPATNKSWKLATLEIERYEGGKQKEAWIFWNGMAFAAQLGLIPAPGEAPKPEEPKTP